MKLLIVNNNFDLSTGGGAERYTLDIIDALKERGHEVYTSTGIEHLEKVDAVYVNNCFDTLSLEKLTARPSIRFIHDHQIYCPGTPKYWFNTQRPCQICTDWRCMYYAFTEKCQSRNPKKFVPQTISKQKELAVNKRFKKLFVASEFMKDMLIENDFAEEQVYVNHLFPYGLTIGSLGSVGSLREEEKPLILYVGRLFKEKGVDYLLRAAAEIKIPFRLIVIGTGWEEQNLKQLCKELNLQSKVEFLGFVQKSDLVNYYQQANVVVVPSVWPEPFGLIGIEAYQYKKPVIAFDSGGISEWLKHSQTGYLVERLNYRQMAERITELLTNIEIANEFGEAGYNLVYQEFTLKKHVDVLEETLKEIIGRR